MHARTRIFVLMHVCAWIHRRAGAPRAAASLLPVRLVGGQPAARARVLPQLCLAALPPQGLPLRAGALVHRPLGPHQRACPPTPSPPPAAPRQRRNSPHTRPHTPARTCGAPRVPHMRRRTLPRAGLGGGARRLGLAPLLLRLVRVVPRHHRRRSGVHLNSRPGPRPRMQPLASPEANLRGSPRDACCAHGQPYPHHHGYACQATPSTWSRRAAATTAGTARRRASTTLASRC